MTALPDPETSRAVLVGVANYRRIERLPAVANNVTALASLLTDPGVWGLPAENCIVVENPETISAVLDPIHEAARSAESALLFYYAGHGLLDEASDLYLGLPDCDHDRLHQAIRFADVRREIVNTARRCRAKVVILDCCYSGRAMSGFMSPANSLADQAVVDGAFLMTASAETKRAQAPVGARYTAFTGALLDVLRDGLRGGPAALDMETIFTQVDREMRAKNYPTPQRRSRDAGHRIVIARNRALAHPVRDSDETRPGRVDPVRNVPPEPAIRSEAREQIGRGETPPTVDPPSIDAPAAAYSGIKLPLEVTGVLASLTFDGEWLTISKSGVAAIHRSQRRIHRSQIVGLTVKQATPLAPGYVQVRIHGVHIPARGRPSQRDPYSMSFRPRANRMMVELQRELDPTVRPSGTDVVGAAANRRPPMRRTTAAQPTNPDNRRTPWPLAIRIAVWLAVAVTGVLEIGAIGITVTDGWPDQTIASAIFANLFSAVPFAGAVWLAVVEVRQRRRARGNRSA